MPNCVCGHPPAFGLLKFFFRGWWQDLHSGHHQILHSTKPTNVRKSENPLRRSTSCAAALRRAAHRMTGSKQTLRDPHSLMIGGKPWGKLPGSDCGGMLRSGAEVSSTKRRSPWVNLRRSVQVGAWIVLSLREDDHLSLLSSELVFEHQNCSTL